MTGTPEKLGRYVIDAELGRGSMGVVYRAHDPRIDRLVALKTLATPPGADEVTGPIKARFLNEGRAAGRLRHPGIVAVYDADEDAATGTVYLAMEHVEGTDLRRLLHEGMTPERVVAIVREVAEALDHAHHHGVIHRDVKPGNILVDPAGHARLTDFGIARLGSSTMTRDGEFLGTPAYMAPEQVLSKPVSGATDVFALGVILYEGLTGRRPFRGDSVVATTHAIVSDKPVRPSIVRDSISPAFDAVLEKALAKDPASRYSTAGALATAAEHALQDRTLVAAARPAAAPVPAALPRSRRGWMALVALIAAVLVVGGVLVGAAMRRKPGGDPLPVASGVATPPVAVATPPARPKASSLPAAPPPSLSGLLAIEVSTMRAGALVVKEGGREVGRITVPAAEKGQKGLKNLVRKRNVTLRLTAGAHPLSFTFTSEDRSVTREVTAVIPLAGTLSCKVDVGMRGRDLDVRMK